MLYASLPKQSNCSINIITQHACCVRGRAVLAGDVLTAVLLAEMSLLMADCR